MPHNIQEILDKLKTWYSHRNSRDLLNNGLIGAGIGGLGLGGARYFFDSNDTPEERRRKALNSLMIGSVLGGSVGAGFTGIRQLAKNISASHPNPIYGEIASLLRMPNGYGGAVAVPAAGVPPAWKELSNLRKDTGVIKNLSEGKGNAFNLGGLTSNTSADYGKHMNNLKSLWDNLTDRKGHFRTNLGANEFIKRVKLDPTQAQMMSDKALRLRQETLTRVLGNAMNQPVHNHGLLGSIWERFGLGNKTRLKDMLNSGYEYHNPLSTGYAATLIPEDTGATSAVGKVAPTIIPPSSPFTPEKIPGYRPFSGASEDALRSSVRGFLRYGIPAYGANQVVNILSRHYFDPSILKAEATQ